MNFFSHLSEIVRRSNHPHFKNFHIEKKVPLTRGGKRGLKGLLLIRVCGKASHSFLSAGGGGEGGHSKGRRGVVAESFSRDLTKEVLKTKGEGGRDINLELRAPVKKKEESYLTSSNIPKSW